MAHLVEGVTLKVQNGNANNLIAHVTTNVSRTFIRTCTTPTHTHAYTHTRIHTHTCNMKVGGQQVYNSIMVYTCVYIQTPTHTHTHTHIHIHIHTHTHAHAHTQTQDESREEGQYTTH